ncbi:HAD-IIA family hydrolase [Nocardioides solisilvae]|uniref:HAD-IIA family hydrolase n=1 Tax=Nocardioides solisilvae TaxID=1542435 RepID=UPI000D74C150|nr:HAD-IIA family hydrolase [Nocardioides solisilvae]
MLRESQVPLVTTHDLVMLDLDGVVYVGDQPVDDVPDVLERVRAGGVSCAFVTNNASRTPAEVAARLEGMGVRAAEQDVVTSAQAAASVLAARWGTGARVLTLGGPGLHGALVAAGLEPLTAPDGTEVALATGYGPEVLWRDVMRAAVAVRDGLPWVASNTDLSIPTPYGRAPGHGVLVRTIADFAGVEPVVAGKPEAPLLEETVRRVGGTAPLMVGDRLDTDILGAARLGLPSLLVLTGVSGIPEVVGAPADQRPSYVSPTMRGLLEPHPGPSVAPDGEAACGGWTARVRDGDLEVTGTGAVADWWRAVAAAGWAFLDSTGEAAGTGRLCAPAS